MLEGEENQGTINQQPGNQKKIHQPGYQQKLPQLSQQEKKPKVSTISPNTMKLNVDPLKYIESLPEFNGKGNDLFTFLDLVDVISPTISKYSVSSQSILLNRIKSKLSGKAREVVEINSNLKTWSEIKKILQDNFGDKKSSSQIFDELRSVTFTSNSVDFYNHITSILRRLNNKVKNESDSENLIKSNIQTALKIFKDKMPEPMRSILFSRNPDTLEKALDILVEGNYAYYSPLKNNVEKNKNFRNYESNKTDFQRTHVTRFNHNNPGPKQNNYNQPVNSRPSQYNNTRNFNLRSSQFNRSQYFRQNHYQNSYNNSNNNNDKSEPMDVDVSVNSRIHSLETQNQVENFHLAASESKTYLI